MKKTYRNLILFSLGVLIAGNILNFVAAYPGSVPYTGEITYPLEITGANYSDLDGDGLPDDILATFLLKSPTGKICYFDAIMDLTLILPSGLTYVMHFRITEVFVELPVTLKLYNTATEEGDYDLHLEADIWGYDINGVTFSGIVADSIIFDPHEFKDGGLPYGIVEY